MPPRRTDKKATRIHVMLDEDELADVDAFFHDARLKNRSDAIRELITLGIKNHAARVAKAKTKPETM